MAAHPRRAGRARGHREPAHARAAIRAAGAHRGAGEAAPRSSTCGPHYRRRRTNGSCSRPEASALRGSSSTGTSRLPRRCPCAGIPGRPATGSRWPGRVAVRSPPGSTSSTGAPCRRRLAGTRPTSFRRRSSSRPSQPQIVDERGEEFFRAADVSWAETNVVQAMARRPQARAYYLLGEEALRRRVRNGRWRRSSPRRRRKRSVRPAATHQSYCWTGASPERGAEERRLPTVPARARAPRCGGRRERYRGVL